MAKISRSGSPHIVQIVGYKNTGKSTLTAALTRHLSSRRLRVAVIKHDGHDHFQMDHEGTDSYRFGQAGASAVVVMSDKRTAIIEQRATSLEEMLIHLSSYDWILIEGYKQAAYPKLLMIRQATDLVLLEELQGVVGVVSWLPEGSIDLPDGGHGEGKGQGWHSVRETELIADWLLKWSESE